MSSRVSLKPPSVEEVKAAGYTDEASEKIAAEEQQKFLDKAPPYDRVVAVEEPLHTIVEVQTLGKVMTSSNQNPVCPTCGNKFLATYAPGTWRCNCCGDTSAKHSY